MSKSASEGRRLRLERALRSNLQKRKKSGITVRKVVSPDSGKISSDSGKISPISPSNEPKDNFEEKYKEKYKEK